MSGIHPFVEKVLSVSLPGTSSQLQAKPRRHLFSVLPSPFPVLLFPHASLGRVTVLPEPSQYSLSMKNFIQPNPLQIKVTHPSVVSSGLSLSVDDSKEKSPLIRLLCGHFYCQPHKPSDYLLLQPLPRQPVSHR